MEVWRWVENGFADGATQMATDQFMVEKTIESRKPVMRLYGWVPFCVSLGYHQSPEKIDLDCCQKRGIDVVRRPTGGRAVLHAEEVTYSVVFPREGISKSKDAAQIYHFIHQGLVRGIRKLGVPAELQKRSLDIRGHYRTPLSISCFSASARHEVVLEGKKLIGSAQRLYPGCILQHGSILTGEAHSELPEFLKGLEPDDKNRMKDEMTKRSISIGKYLGRRVDFRDVVRAVRQGMKEALSIRFEDEDLTQEEKKRVVQLRPDSIIFSAG